MTRLNQIIAVAKDIQSKVKSEQTALYHVDQKGALFEGFNRVYSPHDAEGDKYPSETKKVQLVAADIIKEMATKITTLFDVTATKDFANCSAKADIVVDGEAILKDVPVTYLLWLHKEITDIRTFFSKLPTLDPAEDWVLEPGSGLYKSPPLTSFKTKKVEKALVLHPATKEHPAQTKTVTEDVTVGTWTAVKLSGAVHKNTAKELVARADKLLRAVKMAQEEANHIQASQQSVGEPIMKWLLRDMK